MEIFSVGEDTGDRFRMEERSPMGITLPRIQTPMLKYEIVELLNGFRVRIKIRVWL
jgi:hypothetical protein